METVVNRASSWRVVCFDLDGTLVEGAVFIWDLLHEHFGTDRHRRRLAKQDYFARRISYETWFRHDLDLLSERGADKAAIEAMIREHLRPVPGAAQTLERIKEAGLILGLVSGSLDIVLSAFFPVDLFDHVFLNRIRFDDQGRIAGGVHTPYDLDRKADGLVEIARRSGVGPDRCVFVGDNYNDLSAAGVAGMTVAYRPRSSELRSRADLVIESGPLTAMLPALGLHARADSSQTVE